MKLFLILAALFLSVFFGVKHYAPEYISPYTVNETIIVDKTDSFLAHPTWREILEPLNSNQKEWNGFNIRFLTFSNVDMNPVSEARLPEEVALLSNPGERSTKVGEFINKVETLVDSINKETRGLPKSSIYKTLIEEANRIAATDAKKKFVLVYTDLADHTDSFSIYAAKDKELLRNHPEAVIEKFRRIISPSKLHGVEIYIIFQPKSEVENENFNLMYSKVYRPLLEGAGAHLHTAANLILENP